MTTWSPLNSASTAALAVAHPRTAQFPLVLGRAPDAPGSHQVRSVCGPSRLLTLLQICAGCCSPMHEQVGDRLEARDAWGWRVCHVQQPVEGGEVARWQGTCVPAAELSCWLGWYCRPACGATLQTYGTACICLKARLLPGQGDGQGSRAVPHGPKCRPPSPVPKHLECAASPSPSPF
jgi:hypothetical protein